ncbi:hypothetical protein FGU60_20110 [Escherichia coli]|nr:hypothetical protein [Escherichia coli]
MGRWWRYKWITFHPSLTVRKASWHCRQCHHDYYGEQYCTHCQTGGFSIPRTTQEEICEF